MTQKIQTRIEQIKNSQIPEGYKKTSLGIIPVDWEIRKLSSLLTESKILGNTGNAAKKITIKLWNKGVVAKKELHEGSENTQYYIRKAGQFIYSKLDFLNCAFGIIPDELDNYESTIDLPSFDISKEINSYFLLSIITQKRFYENFGIMFANGGRKARRISQEDFLAMQIFFPPLPEQQKIAEILSAQDKLIELKEKLLVEKQKQKKYLMQQLLGGKLRVGNGEWRAVKLGDVADISTGNADTQDKVNDGLYPFYVRSPKIERINNYTYDGEAILTAGDGVGVGKVIHYVNGKFNFHQRVYKISDFKENCLGKYLYYFFVQNFYNRVIRMSAKNSVDSVRFDMISCMPILLPPLPEQNAIAEILSTADKEIELLQKDIELEKLKKKSLMQLLLMGIVRVKV